MSGRSTSIHDVISVELKSTYRSNSFSLTFEVRKRALNEGDRGSECEVTEEITLYFTTQAEFERIRDALPKASDFHEYV